MERERYVATANEGATIYGLIVGKRYIVEPEWYGYIFVYDLHSDYITVCKEGSFNNYVNLKE